MLRGILAKFSLGYPDQALARSKAAVAEARRLAHLPSLALILAVGAVPFSLLGESAVLGKWADKLVAVASEHGFAFFDAIGTSYRGWVKVKNGDVSEAIPLLQSGTAAFRGTGAELFPPYPVALLASACRIAGRIEESLTLLDEALRMVERIGDCWFAAELNRQKGQLLLRQGNSYAGEQLYRKALRIAQQDSAVESRAPSALMLRGRCRCAQLGIDTVTRPADKGNPS